MTSAMGFDPQDLHLLRIVLIILVVMMAAVWLWHMHASRGNAQIARYDAELKLSQRDWNAWREAVHVLRSDLDGRVRTIEEQLKHMPTKAQLAELEGVVNRLAYQYEAMAESQATIRSTLFRIEDFLLKGKRP